MRDDQLKAHLLKILGKLRQGKANVKLTTDESEAIRTIIRRVPKLRVVK